MPSNKKAARGKTLGLIEEVREVNKRHVNVQLKYEGIG